MEIVQDKWILVAHENIARYMDRGGVDQGDVPELLEGAQLLNTIGIALNVHFSDPTCWTEEELKEAEFGHLCFFKGNSRKAIDVIINKISDECKSKERFSVTVLPIQLYSDGKLYSLSLFRFKANKKWKFIDNVGRIYKDFLDWKENNVLPPGKVCYPMNGHLQRNCKGFVQTRCKTTPMSTSQAKFMKGADMGTGVIGIVGAVGTVFLTGGAALPFVLAGIGSAIYTTARSVYHLTDRKNHGQTLSPLNSHENFSLWLGIGANVISFGAMGATIRLSTLAFQGKNVSQGLRLFVNLISGTSLGVNSVAVANSLAYMAIHFEQMTPLDVLMQVASVAFWAKSVFSYKPAAKLVKEIHNQVLNGYSTSMGHAHEDFQKFRIKFNNDKQLVKFYFRYLKQGLDPAQVSDVLVEIYQMGAGAQFFSVDPAQMTININGHTFTMEFLMSIKSCNRQTVFNILAGMTDNQTESFNKLRSQIQDDVALFYLIAEVSKDFNIQPEETAKHLIDFWTLIDDSSSQIPLTIKLNKDTSITLGNGFTFNLDQIIQFADDRQVMTLLKEKFFQFDSEDTIEFNQLRKIFNDDAKLFGWIAKADKMNIGNAIETFLDLESKETEDFKLFQILKLEECTSNECGMVSFRGIFRVSIFFLAQLDAKLLNELIQMITDTEIVDSRLENFHARVGNFRIQSEFNRQTAQKWFDEVSKNFTRITLRYGKPTPDDLNQLYQIKSLFCRFEKESQMVIAGFVFALNPKSVADFCSCCDFAYTYLMNAIEKYTIEMYKNQESVKKNDIKSIRMWREENVINDMKNNCRTGKLEYAKLKMNVTRNKMFDKNPLAIKDGLSDKDLVKAIVARVKERDIIKFESHAAAIVQCYKRSKHDARKFADRANFIIQDSKSRSSVWRCQEGVTRVVEFVNINGRVELTEQFENIYLNSFNEFESK